ncbi:hypothetical protein [uncultured Roseobacter sp.]|uniref:hypothetical protein n=1 Tax=uncultured Roseobacter sp. TaxID=114847 RepID=UPI002607A65A|nr:hypothetical protein [uncultured Roseobacter sp.]
MKAPANKQDTKSRSAARVSTTAGGVVVPGLAAPGAQRLARLKHLADRETSSSQQPLPPGGPSPHHRAVIQGKFSDEAEETASFVKFRNHFAEQLAGLEIGEQMGFFAALRDDPHPFTLKDIPSEIAKRRKPIPAVTPRAQRPPSPAAVPKSTGKSEEPDRKEAAPAVASSSKKAAAKGAATPSMIINYVWLGNRKLGSLERFNLFSWRTLGHRVQVFALRFDGDPATAGSVGLDPGDADVIDLRQMLGVDKKETAEAKADSKDPRAILRGARGLMLSWIDQLAKDESEITFIYNLVDLVKSYIGASRRGIVLDLKIGPSEHLGKYAEAFDTKFISFSRGGKTGASVENQSMGTMQEADDLRVKYAENLRNKYENKMYGDVLGPMEKNPRDKHFDKITGWHGRSFDQMRGDALNVSEYAPDGKKIDPESKSYDVDEPGGSSKGPFRVFKRADQQTNQGSGAARAQPIKPLAQSVYETQLAEHIDEENGFAAKAGDAMSGIDKPKT